MKIFFSGTGSRSKILYDIGVRNYLFSYYELNKSNSLNKIFQELISLNCNIMIDSGAHTFQKGVVKVDYDKFLNEYIVFINKYKKHIEMYVELDIENIVGLPQVEKWTKKLTEEIGIPPVVVWHRDRGFDYWKFMAITYPIIGFSGFITTPEGGSEVPNKYLPLFLKIAKNNNSKVHGFGYTRFSNPLLRHFYSVDSTSWLTGGKFNRVFGSSIRGRKNVNHTEKDLHNVKYTLEQQKKYIC